MNSRMEETEDLEETKKEDAIIILILNRVTELEFESILEYDLEWSSSSSARDPIEIESVHWCGPMVVLAR